jgi:hypothetical protein
MMKAFNVPHNWEGKSHPPHTLTCNDYEREVMANDKADDSVGESLIPADRTDPVRLMFSNQPVATTSLQIRVSGILDEVQVKFNQRNADYRDADGFEPSEVLGIRGQFAELWRKVWKLKNALWDGREMVGESAEEILMDLMGHCALAIDMIRRKRDGVQGTD